jgi:restriction system protein
MGITARRSPISAYTRDTINDVIAERMNLTAEDLAEPMNSDSRTKYEWRSYFSTTHLKKAGCIVSVGSKTFQITATGQALLAENLPSITSAVLRERYPSYVEFLAGNRGKGRKFVAETSTEPEDAADEVVAAAEAEDLESALLDRVKTCSPAYFERLVVKLLVEMGYGGSLDEAEAALFTGKSGDGGIDGVIKQDPLGLEKVYVQAKRYTEANVGRPTVQGFVGALDGKRKGILFTTSSFSKEAREYAAKSEKTVILVNGAQIAELMLKYGLGVKTVTCIDDDFFGEK